MKKEREEEKKNLPSAMNRYRIELQKQDYMFPAYFEFKEN